MSARATVLSSITDNGADRASFPDGRAPTFREVVSAYGASVLGPPGRPEESPSVSHILIPHQNRTAEPKTSDRARKLANALAKRGKKQAFRQPTWYSMPGM